MNWRSRLRRVAAGFAACLVLGSAPASAGLLRDNELIMRLLRSGELDLGPELALTLPLEHSQLQIRRVGLRLGEHSIRAAFRDKSRSIPASSSLNVRYRDTYYNEVAAFVVARELGLDMVPPTVLREIGLSRSGLKPAAKLREGSLQLWVETAAVSAPLLGKLWAIDHSRAFHRMPRIKHQTCKLQRLASRPVSLDFIEGLRRWDPERAEAALRSAGLSDKQIGSLHLDVFDRRLDKMRAYLKELQQESGLADEEFYSSGIWHHVN